MLDIDDLIRRARRSLFHTDLPDEELLAACLSLHAVLRDRIAIPRCYLTEVTAAAPGLFALPPYTMLDTLFGGEPETIRRETALQLHQLGFSVATITHARSSPPARSALLEICDACLCCRWGDGMVHYEMARFTPFTHEDITVHLWPRGEWQSLKPAMLCPRLRPLLERRTSAEKAVRANAAYCSTTAEPIREHTQYERLYREKVEKEWQSHWLPSHFYLPEAAEQALLRALQLEGRWFAKP